MTTPFLCDACHQWIPRPPDTNLYGEFEQTVVNGICPPCCADGWDYDSHLKVKQYDDEEESSTNVTDKEA
jgi:hypothetical protein